MFHGYIVSFFERLFFSPSLFDWVVALSLLPLSLLYAFIMLLRRLITPRNIYSVPIISVGNLIVGGSGKTPFIISLASRYENVTIISRGYGRKSKGLVVVSRRGEIVTNVYESGDEPMLIAMSLKQASVIVSEDRDKAIKLAIEDGAKVIFLDDGFNKINIEKYEILLFPEKIANYMPFPSGPFREFYYSKIFSDINLYENFDFKRVVKIENKTEKMLLVTAISNPKRLEKYLPESIVGKVYFEDHSYFNEKELEERLLVSGAFSLLVTEKDKVKMKDFKLPLSVMQLKLQIKNEILEKVDKYIREYKYEE